MKNQSLFLFVSALLVSFQSVGQFKSGDNVIVRENVTDDLYVAGGTVVIDAPVAGDLIVAGGTITINDSIVQDILAAGGNIIVNGRVGDDIRCAGGTITISDNIQGDLVVAGGRITIDKDVIIHGNIISSGGEVILNGTANGFVRTASGTFVLNGQVKKHLDSRGGSITVNGPVFGNSILAANSLDIGPDAMFHKDVRYWLEEGEVEFANSLHGSEAVFDPSLSLEYGKWQYLGFASFLMLLWYLSTALIMVILIQYLFGHTFKKAANTIKEASMKSLGIGVLFLIGVPVAVILLMITIVGLPVGILLAIGYVTVLLFSTVIVSVIAANWISNTYYQSSWGMRRIVLIAFVLFIFLKLASLTPIVGPLVMALLACMAFGGVLQNVQWKRTPPVEPTVI